MAPVKKQSHRDYIYHKKSINIFIVLPPDIFKSALYIEISLF